MRTTCLAAVTAAFLAAGCSDGDDNESAAPAALEECPEALNQSPIDLPATPQRQNLPDLAATYGETHVLVRNTGRAEQYDYEPGSVLRVGEHGYELLQFHFHAHSEHSIGGAFAPLELHLVHRDDAGKMLVVAVLFDVGEHNAALDDADWSALPAASGAVYEDAGHRFNAAEFFAGGPTYRYTGSLTAPPCSGDVAWVVFSRRLQLDQAQLDQMTHVYDHNFRPPQPLDERSIDFGE